MNDQPSIGELIAAVQHFLSAELLPTISEPRVRYQTLIAANVLTIVAREIAQAPELLALEWQRLAQLLHHGSAAPVGSEALSEAVAELNQALCTAIDAGQFDQPAGFRALLHHCQQTAREHLYINNPKYLQRLGAELTI